MSLLDSFFSMGFKGAKCKTLLKLAIPRIKLLRNRREIQIKQMRRDSAKLLETGQEATARVRVEHVIREENMMAAQEILELFCELIVVRLPIIETQRECPLDLKEAISSVCFAAPRCADLPELLQVQMLFASKYGKGFILAATELTPNCGVNCQLIELLSVRAPSPEKKLKLLKEIAEEHELDWDPATTETEFFKPQEDLLNGPTQFISGSKLPLPEDKHDETLNSGPDQVHNKQPDSDISIEMLAFPDVPTAELQPAKYKSTSATTMSPSMPATSHPEIVHEVSGHSGNTENLPQELYLEPEVVIQERPVANEAELPNSSVGAEDRQFVPFIVPPSQSSARQSSLPGTISKTKSEPNVDLQDVLAAAESAERAAAAARSAASLAQIRISELTQKKIDVPQSGCKNPFHMDGPDRSAVVENFDHKTSLEDPDGISNSRVFHHQVHEDDPSQLPNLPLHDKLIFGFDSSPSNDHLSHQEPVQHQPQRLTSVDDDSYFSYPNLFTSQNSNLGFASHSFTDNSRSN